MEKKKIVMTSTLGSNVALVIAVVCCLFVTISHFLGNEDYSLLTNLAGITSAICAILSVILRKRNKAD